ncbi:putative carbonic anhydrase 3 isoform X2 [Episyrphus balteatus]|uniref:putative carbonic anhydrase 3 isoform X2 n=1 Tax=Episyrphus balteatus TaxID=286459 RepID=UPI002486B9F1|nr:putative carbonic anhydrase 3 isoform X2 [Episyrphus balteatus]
MIGVNILLTGFFLLPIAVNGFNYDNTLKWISENPLCSGFRQSPISLDRQISSPLVIYPITFHNFDVELQGPVHVTNNGNAVEMDVENTVNGFHPFITGGGLSGVYQVENVHFHWGSNQIRGSEHAVGGQKYDLEMHIVCKNIKFGSLAEARDDPFGIAVMGVLFKEVDTNSLEHPLKPIIDLLPSLTKAGSVSQIAQPLKLSSLLSRLNPKYFYTYRGSLTTPPCSQSVTWLVFEHIQEIPPNSLHQFWRLRDADDLPLVNNFRPLQQLNNRKIFSRNAKRK